MAIAKVFQDAIDSKLSTFEDVNGGTGFNFMELEVGYTFIYKGDTWTYVGFYKGDSVWLKKGSKYIFTLAMIFGQFAWFSNVSKTKILLQNIALQTGNEIKQCLLANPYIQA